MIDRKSLTLATAITVGAVLGAGAQTVTNLVGPLPPDGIVYGFLLMDGSTNYPLVRITNTKSGDVTYAYAHHPSSMGVATGTRIVSTYFDVPAGIEKGPSTLQVVANGIPSAPVPVNVGAQAFSAAR